MDSLVQMKIAINEKAISNFAPGPNFSNFSNFSNDGQFWIGEFGADQLEQTSKGLNLVLSKKIKIENFELGPSISVGPGVEVENNEIRFTCTFPLETTIVTDKYDVIGSDETIYRNEIGHLNYKIEIENSSTLIGQPIRFKIIPANPGLVFSRIRSCRVTHALNDKLKYDLFWPIRNQRSRRGLIGQSHFCKSSLLNFEIKSSFQSKYTQQFQFTSFKWNLGNVLDRFSLNLVQISCSRTKKKTQSWILIF